MLKRSYLVGIGVLVVATATALTIAIVLKLAGRTPASTTNPTQTNTDQRLPSAGSLPGSITGDASLPPVPPLEDAAAATTPTTELSRSAAAFAERFGSYSNESNYSNISDLQVEMTPSMREWSVSYIAQLKAAGATSASYRGTTTRALSSMVASFDASAGKATVLVSTQRQQGDGTASNISVTYHPLRLDYVKTGDHWYVDAAYWDP